MELSLWLNTSPMLNDDVGITYNSNGIGSLLWHAHRFLKSDSYIKQTLQAVSTLEVDREEL